uniref:Uncharacterized protein n=1 Tax=Romanomermis culicivorax TaxID=13658 RepID=A0A915JXF6_ROMCU
AIRFIIFSKHQLYGFEKIDNLSDFIKLGRFLVYGFEKIDNLSALVKLILGNLKFLTDFTLKMGSKNDMREDDLCDDSFVVNLDQAINRRCSQMNNKNNNNNNNNQKNNDSNCRNCNFYSQGGYRNPLMLADNRNRKIMKAAELSQKLASETKNSQLVAVVLGVGAIIAGYYYYGKNPKLNEKQKLVQAEKMSSADAKNPPQPASKAGETAKNPGSS